MGHGVENKQQVAKRVLEFEKIVGELIHSALPEYNHYADK
jgi:hypothetical protein